MDSCMMEELNFFRLAKIIFSFVNEALRHVFLEEWSKVYKAQWTNDYASGQLIIIKEKEGEKKLKRESVLFRSSHVEILTLISYGNIHRWDSSTLFFVLLNSHALNLRDSEKGYRRKSERSAPFVKGEYIDDLRDVRNNFFHKCEAKISDDDYRDKVKLIRFVVVALLGETHETVRKFDEFAVQECFSGEQMVLLRAKISQEVENLCSLSVELDNVETNVQIVEKLISGEIDFLFSEPRICRSISEVTRKDVEGKLNKDRFGDLTARISNISSQVKNIVSQCNDLKDFKKLLREEVEVFFHSRDWEGFENYVDDKLRSCKLVDATLLVKMELAKGLCYQRKFQDALELLTSLISSAHLTRQSAIYLGNIFQLMSVVYREIKNVDEATKYEDLATSILGKYKSNQSTL